MKNKKIYNIIYDNGSSTYVEELTKEILQNLGHGYCDVFDVTDPQSPIQIV